MHALISIQTIDSLPDACLISAFLLVEKQSSCGIFVDISQDNYVSELIQISHYELLRMISVVIDYAMLTRLRILLLNQMTIHFV